MPTDPRDYFRQAQAAAWALTRVGSQDYANLCQQFLENAYGTTGQYPTAAAASKALIRDRDLSKAKVGSLLFFAPHASNGMAGHAAIYLGAGRMVGSTNGGVGITSVSDPYWSNLFVGWGDPPKEWKGRSLSSDDIAKGAGNFVDQIVRLTASSTAEAAPAQSPAAAPEAAPMTQSVQQSQDQKIARLLSLLEDPPPGQEYYVIPAPTPQDPDNVRVVLGAAGQKAIATRDPLGNVPIVGGLRAAARAMGSQNVTPQPAKGQELGAGNLDQLIADGEMNEEGAGAVEGDPNDANRLVSQAYAQYREALQSRDQFDQANPGATAKQRQPVVDAVNRALTTYRQAYDSANRATRTPAADKPTVASSVDPSERKIVYYDPKTGSFQATDNPGFDDTFVNPSVANNREDNAAALARQTASDTAAMERLRVSEGGNRYATDANVGVRREEIAAARADRAADLAWRQAQAAIENSYRNGELTLRQAEAASQESYRRIQLQLDHDRNLISTRGQDVTVRGQDLGAATDQRGQDLNRMNTLLQQGTGLLETGLRSGLDAGSNAASNAIRMLPFAAPEGTAEDLSTLNNAIMQAGRPGFQMPTMQPRKMAMPFDPTQLAMDVAARVMGQVGPQAQSMMQQGGVGAGAFQAPPQIDPSMFKLPSPVPVLPGPIQLPPAAFQAPG